MGIPPFVNRKRPLDDDDRPGPSKRTTDDKPGPSGVHDRGPSGVHDRDPSGVMFGVEVKEEPIEDITILDSFEARPY